MIMQRQVAIGLFILFISSCSTSSNQSSHTKPNSVSDIVSQGIISHADAKRGSGVSLDDKAKQRIHEGFKAVIMNDDKKAKLSYGRAHKYMPEFLQFAYDLRFRNFDRAKDVVEKLPYTTEEKEFWKTLVDKKPAVISKYVCEWMKETKFSVVNSKPESKEMEWFGEYMKVIDDLQKEYQTKNPLKKPVFDSNFEKFKFTDEKRNPVALSAEAQKALLDSAFFDKFRNMQRRDTNFYKANYWNTYKVVNYTPYYSPSNAWDLYWSLGVTEHPKKNHFMRRIKGIVKDMRENLVMHRFVGSKLIQDEDDYKKAGSIAYFINRYPMISAFLRFDFTLNDCGYNPKKE